MQRPTILVLADNAITRRTVRVSAEGHGFEVFEATGIDQAVERAGQGGVALVLLEIVTPGQQTDYQASSRLRSNLPAASPIVAIAPPLTRQDQALARACGIAEILPKPLEPSRLADLLRRRGGARSQLSQRFLKGGGEGGASSMQMRRPSFELDSREEAAAVVAEAQLGVLGNVPELAGESGRIVRERLEESAKLTAELTRRVALHEAGLSILAGLAESLDETATVDAILDRLLRQGLDSAGISKGAAYLREPDGALALRCQVGFKSASVSQLLGFFGRPDILQDAIEQGVALRIPAADIAIPEEKKWLESAGSKSLMVAPFGKPERIQGVLVMASRSLLFGEDWLAFSRGCAGLIGQALELTKALERRETDARRQTAIADLGRRAIARDSLDEVLQDAANVVESALEADLAAIFVPSTDQQLGGAYVMRAQAGWGGEAARDAREKPGSRSLAGLVHGSLEAVISGDLAKETRFDPMPAALVRGASSVAAVPIPGGRRGFGVLAAYARRKGALEKDDARFLEGVSAVIASAVERDAVQAALKESDERLRQSQKMDAIGRLAGGIAHDFNNLLTGITGYCDILLVTVKRDDPVRADVEEIRKAAQRASALTRQLLAFSRKQPVAPRILDVNQLVSSLEKMLRRLIGEDIDLDVRTGGLGTVSADQSQIEQVIVNLCVNARDAMPKGGRLLVETSDVELDEEYARRHVGVEPGRYVLVAVTDTGHGMSKETLSRLFEPFFTTKEQGKGTGLGLSTVYGIVKQSQGGVWVYSEVGIGTTFKVYLPRADLPATVSVETQSGAAPPVGTETVLLAEDDDLVRDLTGRILRRAGYTVLEASRGMQALELGRREAKRVDILVTDVIMPEMSGKDLARRLSETKPGLKVLYTSGYTGQRISGDLEEKEGGFEFLSKPFSAKALLEAVRRTLESESKVA